MSMNSNGPGSSRRATTSWSDSSRVRSDTQFHTRPLSSGCIVSRKRNVEPVCASTFTSAYSVNRSGHDGRSLVIRQTWSRSASMTIELSVWPTVRLSCSMVLIWFLQEVRDGGVWVDGSGHPRRVVDGAGDGGDDLAERVAVGAVVGHLGAEAVVQLGLHGQEGQRVQPDVGEAGVGVRRVRRRGEPRLLGEQVHEVGEGEGGIEHGAVPLGSGARVGRWRPVIAGGGLDELKGAARARGQGWRRG